MDYLEHLSALFGLCVPPPDLHWRTISRQQASTIWPSLWTVRSMSIWMPPATFWGTAGEYPDAGDARRPLQRISSATESKKDAGL